MKGKASRALMLNYKHLRQLLVDGRGWAPSSILQRASSSAPQSQVVDKGVGGPASAIPLYIGRLALRRL
eukprot:1350075-Pyramimonas_sp.AAC.1